MPTCSSFARAKWIAKNLRMWVKTNMMFQCRSELRADKTLELHRRLAINEVECAVELEREAGVNQLHNVSLRIIG